MARALKVYRTAIGFHDAYVAAPSKKAALKAWDTEKDLFARGAADVVTDPKLTSELLANPGKVIKRIRGNLEDHLAAAGPTLQRREKRLSPDREDKPGKAERPKPKANPKPRPSRQAVDEAEAVVTQFERRSREEIAQIREKEAALRQERETLERQHRVEANKLASRLEKAETRYREDMDRWRSD